MHDIGSRVVKETQESQENDKRRKKEAQESKGSGHNLHIEIEQDERRGK